MPPYQKIISLPDGSRIFRGTQITIPGTNNNGLRHITITADVELDNPTVSLNIYASKSSPNFTMNNMIITYPNSPNHPDKQTQIDADFSNALKDDDGHPVPVTFDVFCDFIIIG